MEENNKSALQESVTEAKESDAGNNDRDVQGKEDITMDTEKDEQKDWEPSDMDTLLDEAIALSEYLARHGGVSVGEESVGGTDASQTSGKNHNNKKLAPLYPGHSELIDAIAAAKGRGSVENWKKLSKAYARVASAAYREHGVSGKSILDTVSGRKNKISKKSWPIALGIGFFAIALAFEWLKAWAGEISDPINELGAIARFVYEATRSLAPFIVPALWGAIGACTFLAKRISDKLFEMSYEVNRMQGIAARIFLGAILGLITDILLFGTGSTVDPVAVGELEMGTIVAAFIVGLSVKPIYQGFEALSEGIAKRFSPSKDQG